MQHFDFNLLKVLQALVETRSTKRAAEQLHLSQSAVSHALSRLRDSFDDKLFVRDRYGLVPTERCLDIEKSLPDIIERIDALFNSGSAFDPSKYEGKISISINNALRNTIGPRLFEQLRNKAPNARFEFMDWTWQVESALLSRKIHMAIGYGPESYSKQIKQDRMPTHNYMICMREDHPLLKLGKFGVEKLSQYPLVLVRTPDWRTRHEAAEEVFLKAGTVPDILLKSDSVEVSFNAISNSDAIFPLTNTIRNLPEGVVAIHPNKELAKQNPNVYAYYLYQTQDSPFINWLISEVKNVLQATF